MTGMNPQRAARGRAHQREKPAMVPCRRTLFCRQAAAPPESWTVTNYYKQAVYDPKESKIGDIDDVLVDKSGKVTGLVIGVGGFLGAGEKDVIVPFTAVKTAKKNDKWWLTLS